MRLKFRIILNVKEDVLRDIIVDSSTNLLEFSKIISDQFGFDSTEISTFHISNETWEQLEEIKIFKIDDQDEIMDKAPISNYFVLNGDKMIFVYDFLNYWTFFVELHEIDELINSKSNFECINSVGNIPKEAPSDIYKNTDIVDNFDQDESLNL